jgi:alpha-L-fucosidase 2
LPDDPSEELWYLQPAERWLEALPIGNGRLGGMIFGGVDLERIALSESTAWSGAPGSGDVNPKSLPHLAEIRQLLFAGRYAEARDLCQRYLLAHPTSFGTNLPLPELQFSFENAGPATDYRRSLDLDQAVARVSYRRKGGLCSREFFASHPSKVIVAHFKCEPGQDLSFRASFRDSAIPAEVTSEQNNTLILRGHAYENLHSNGSQGVSLQIRISVMTEGGQVVSADRMLEVRNARSATVLIAAATNYSGADPDDICRRHLADAEKRTYTQLRMDHVNDHQALYRRVSLHLGKSQYRVALQPTDVRRKALSSGVEDPELIALFFQYGRYLTIAGSREDSPMPLALQGIWNDGLASSMGWTDDFHLDINTEQNYWAAEVCNLPECQVPLFRLIDGLIVSGRRTARDMYGAPGWVCHTVTNPWGYTAPGWGIGWGLFVTAGIWIARQIWDHYTFSADVEFLRTRAYPVLREAADFFLAYMVPEPKHGWLVTGPSDSPENWFLAPSGEQCAESMGSTVDRVFVYALFTMCIEASKTLGIDPELRHTLEGARAKLPPFQIGRYGQLQEWLEDFREADPNHRHTSHLAALYPEDQISPGATPELARAAQVTIERRLNAPHWEQSEWGRANLVAYSARLLNGDKACDYLVSLISKAADDNLLTFSSAGVAGASQNIFAIDGNTAGTAGIAEMLLQSQRGEIRLLPALPAAWPAGVIRGLRARGGFQVEIQWEQGTLRSATISSKSGGSTPVRYRNGVIQVNLRRGETKRFDPADFHQESGKGI